MQVYAVHEITSYLRELVESSPLLSNVWVAGEVSNTSRPASGHTYFTLKDEHGQLRAVFFAPRYVARPSTSRLIENGNAIIAHGRLSIYEARGEVQLLVDFVQPEGAGALQAEFERLKTMLEEEGLFDVSRKRRLPAIPRRIGVVTSESGAVFHDICHVLERRWPLVEVVLAPTPVQGPSAVSGILGALEQLDAQGDIDVIIAGRGGGSIEELWAFNDERVARAIYASATPIVSAVGHETDYTIADYVADVRAPTPSAAAEIVSPDRTEVSARIVVRASDLEIALHKHVRLARDDTARSVARLERALPDIRRYRERVREVTRIASTAIERDHRSITHGVGNCVWRLKSLDPLATLDRGYAIVQRGRHIVASVSTTKPGDALDVRVKDGSFGVRVQGAPVARKRARKPVPDAQAPLFSMPEERA